eukprot:363634-Chlamydomonas_euryale.AAC.3
MHCPLGKAAQRVHVTSSAEQHTYCMQVANDTLRLRIQEVDAVVAGINRKRQSIARMEKEM